MTSALQVFEFEGHPVAPITYKGQPMWPAREVGKALGYEDDDRFVQAITHDWAEEIEEGVGFLRFVGDELATIQRLRNDPADSAGSNVGRGGARSLVMLTEPGIFLACLLSKKPAGKRLRRWLATEVLPTLARGGAVGGTQGEGLSRLAQRVCDLEAQAVNMQANWEAVRFLLVEPRTAPPRLGLSRQLPLALPDHQARRAPTLEQVLPLLEGHDAVSTVDLAAALGADDRGTATLIAGLLRGLGWGRRQIRYGHVVKRMFIRPIEA